LKASPINDVREMYDDTADSYAQMMDTEIELPVYAEVLARLKTRIENTPGALIDTACGSGHMLSMYREHFEPLREIVGADLSPAMVAITQKRLGPDVRMLVGDMRDLPEIESCSAAAVLNYFAIHHLDAVGVRESLQEWFRILVAGGQLLLAAWEGTGLIDYGDASDIVAIRYTSAEIASMAKDAGFEITRCVADPVQDFYMDAVYLECAK
jgi:ubiquinone/menaquinone biosynthesis C-methylase UbiE